MLTRVSNQVRTIPDLAASLTDSALEAVAAAGVGGDSVAMELGLWRALTAQLEQELCTCR
jgi:hypothetical protein